MTAALGGAAPAPAGSRILSVPRNIDVMPPGGVEVLGYLYATVANDGTQHYLVAEWTIPPFTARPDGSLGLPTTPDSQLRLRYARIEWSTVDLTVPPPLTLTVLVNGRRITGAPAQLMLQAAAPGTPALELPLFADLPPTGGTLAVQVVNTGAAAQFVGVYLYGWLASMTLADGTSYE